MPIYKGINIERAALIKHVSRRPFARNNASEVREQITRTDNVF